MNLLNTLRNLTLKPSSSSRNSESFSEERRRLRREEQQQLNRSNGKFRFTLGSSSSSLASSSSFLRRSQRQPRRHDKGKDRGSDLEKEFAFRRQSLRSRRRHDEEAEEEDDRFTTSTETNLPAVSFSSSTAAAGKRVNTHNSRFNFFPLRGAKRSVVSSPFTYFANVGVGYRIRRVSQSFSPLSFKDWRGSFERALPRPRKASPSTASTLL